MTQNDEIGENEPYKLLIKKMLTDILNAKSATEDSYLDAKSITENEEVKLRLIRFVVNVENNFFSAEFLIKDPYFTPAIEKVGYGFEIYHNLNF